MLAKVDEMLIFSILRNFITPFCIAYAFVYPSNTTASGRSCRKIWEFEPKICSSQTYLTSHKTLALLHFVTVPSDR